MTTYYKIDITHTEEEEKEDGQGNWDTECKVFNRTTETRATLEEVYSYLDTTYGNMDISKDYLYKDTSKGTIIAGYCYKYKNSDISHNSEEWLQVDWVSIRKVTEKEITYKKLYKVDYSNS